MQAVFRNMRTLTWGTFPTCRQPNGTLETCPTTCSHRAQESRPKALATRVAVCAIAACACLVGCDGQPGPEGARPASPPPTPPAPAPKAETLAEVEARAPSAHAPETVAARQEAIRLAREGETAEAESLMRGHVEQIAKRYGSDSPQYAWAQYDSSSVCLVLGQLPQAIEALKKACQVDAGDDRQATRDRLTFVMNLGELLTLAGELDEAERVLREGVRGREALYGRRHAGYAYGMEPLADVLTRKGKHEEALRLAEEAVAIFAAEGHARVATAMALRAGILAAMGSDRPLFAGVDKVADWQLPDLVDSVVGQVSLQQPDAAQKLLEGLLPVAQKRLGATHPKTVNLWLALSNVGRAAGRHDRRAEALRHALAAFEEWGNEVLAIEALEGLASAQGDAGQTEAALKTYQTAKQRAASLGNAAVESAAARNYGLYLAELKRPEEARPQLEEALAKATASGDAALVGSAQAALGIFLQHQGEREAARKLLAAACRRLDPLSVDGLCARSHLTAIETGAECGCSKQTMDWAISQGLRQYVMDRAPKGLLEDVQVKLSPDGVELHPKTARTPTAEEKEQVDRLIRHAVTHFQGEVQRGPGADAYRPSPKP